jgi:sucrose-6-phosphate hydrolase SacC (GH32 family)
MTHFILTLLIVSALSVSAQTISAATPAPDLYHETLRPQFHFTARQWTVNKPQPGHREEGWLNDPNGLIYYAGEYHLFAQRWAHCWIHATSTDLLHWTEFPPAIWETSPGSGTQSGTAVIDWKNTSGLSPEPANPPFICFWPTWDNATQNISYSLDHGRTFKPYDRNPILRHGERDPDVFWHEPTHSWIMFLYDHGSYRIFTSPNLLTWSDTGNTIPKSTECPDVFELPVDADKSKLRWIVIRGNGNYSLGQFDGRKFTEETPQMPCDSGPHFYATQTWKDAPGGRHIQLAWMPGGRYPDMPFNQQMTFPRELTLRTTPQGVRLFREPIPEIAKLHGSETDLPSRDLVSGIHQPLIDQGESLHLQMSVSIPPSGTLILHVLGTDVVLNHNSLESDHNTPLTAEPLTYVELLVDRTSIEVFGNHGEVSLSRCILPAGGGISMDYKGDAGSIGPVKIWEVNTTWPDHVAVTP